MAHRSSLILALLVGAAGDAAAQQQIRARVMVLVDTSGSMLWHFNNNNSCGGDGSTSYRDGMGGPLVWYPGADGINSRLFGAKKALADVVNGAGDLDFGLMRYAVDTQCADTVRNCCTFGNPRCINASYTNGNITWNGGCGPMANGIATNGGQVLVRPADLNATGSILRWINGVEDFRDSGNGWPMDGELRAAGSTPLAGSARTALSAWYQPVYDVSKMGSGKYNANDPQFDPQLDCRPYVLVMMTDGGDSCDNDITNGPPNAVAAIYAKNPQNPVRTFVIGVAIANQAEVSVLNAMAKAGGTNTARFANNTVDISAAFADIAASSVKVEQCNGLDDNCNGLVDEGFDKGVACTVSVGACQRAGIKKCDAMNKLQTTCCVDDKLPNGACAPLVAGMPKAEICNRVDDDCNGLVDDGITCSNNCQPETCNGKDDDCDGVIDNAPVDVGAPCGLNLGQCKPGLTSCLNGKGQDITQGFMPDVGDHLECQGGVMPIPEACNGFDDDCDGVIDGVNQACYGGPKGTLNVGICLAGLQRCTAQPNSGVASWGPCVGEIVPRMEICDGVDNDCDGKLDNVMGAGAPCCPSGLCGVGACAAGSMQCSGGSLTCSGGTGPRPEVCNGIDDDCNGKVDDLPNVGKACVPQGGCAGVLACDPVQMMVVCTTQGMGGKELCNNLDDDCDGMIDEPNEVKMFDARVGIPCGPMNNMGACKPGTSECRNGQIVCTGAVTPSAEACNCKDDDCNGLVDDNAFCPQGTRCVGCGCYAPCGGGEFPCPGGYDCRDLKKDESCDQPGRNADCFCIPQQTCDPPCKQNEVCRPLPPPAMNGKCVDICAGVVCQPEHVCKNGVCVDDSCVVVPSKCKTCDGVSGERCDIQQRKCVPNLCCGKDCQGGVCQPLSGQCTKSCVNVKCAAGQRCFDGACIDDKCAGRSCPEAKACDPNTGDCVPNLCVRSPCFGKQVCCGGTCIANPCDLTICAEGFKCTVDVITCNVSCDTPVVDQSAQDRVVGAGGGGFGCAVGGEAERSTSAEMIGLLAIGLALGLRRRRRRARAD